MKTYSGIEIDGKKVIYVRYPGGRKVVMPMHRKHSAEDTHDWGQNSAESLDTALSILFNAFGIEYCDEAVCSCYSDWVVESYQTFDAELVSKLENNYWKLTQESICDWTFDFLRTQRNQKDQDLVTTKS